MLAVLLSRGVLVSSVCCACFPERCCGLDILTRTVVACLITPGLTGAPMKEVRSVGTMTEEVLQLAN